MFDSNFLDFVECLNKNNVDYVIVGGYAVVINGHSRTTGDMDFFVRRTGENAAKVIKAIDDFGFGSIGFTIADVLDENGFMRMGVEPLRIDILSSLPGVNFDDVFIEAKEYEEEGVKMKVIHINHLIQNKLAVGRPQDMADVKALQKILKRTR
jgi:predicted nucleotidyltransferase